MYFFSNALNILCDFVAPIFNTQPAIEENLIAEFHAEIINTQISPAAAEIDVNSQDTLWSEFLRFQEEPSQETTNSLEDATALAWSKVESESDRSSAGSDDSESEDASRSSTSEYEQESFETYKPKVIQLCRDIGLGDPVEVERMLGGSYNRVIGLKFDRGAHQNCVLRIPREPYDENEPDKIKEQVFISHYLSYFKYLKNPTIVAHDATCDNVLASQWVLQRRIQGTCMQDCYYALPLAEKLQVVNAIARLVLKMEKINMSSPGRVSTTSLLIDRSHTRLSDPASITIAGFPFNPRENMPSFPASSLASMLGQLFEYRKTHPKTKPYAAAMYERLAAMAQEMELAGLTCSSDIENVLWHWDFCARNIMLEQVPGEEIATLNPNDQVKYTEEAYQSGLVSGNIVSDWSGDGGSINSPTGFDSPKSSLVWDVSGVLDWDDVMSAPLVLTRRLQSWLWLNDIDRSDGWLDNYDIDTSRELTEEELVIKTHFDEVMACGSASYMEDTYGRGVWLRKLAKHAINGLVSGNDFEDYDKLVEDWDKHFEALGHVPFVATPVEKSIKGTKISQTMMKEPTEGMVVVSGQIVQEKERSVRYGGGFSLCWTWAGEC